MSSRLFQLALGVATAPFGLGRQLRSGGDNRDGNHSDGGNTSRRIEIMLKNVGDTAMLATVQVGHRELDCIMDTGSPDQVIFSTECETCGDPTKTYNCHEDAQCTLGTHESIHTYNSGEAVCKDAKTSLTVVDTNEQLKVAVPQAQVWLVTQAQLDTEQDDNMQCIFGLGPAKGGLASAKTDYNNVKGYAKQSDDPSDQEKLGPFVEEMKQHVAYMKTWSMWQESAQLSSMSFCLHPTLGHNGLLYMHDDFPERTPEAFVHAKVQGGEQWQAAITDIEVSFGGGKTVSGCKGDKANCKAVLDSGTSLIGAPWDFNDALRDMLLDQMPKYGCGDDAMDKYPVLTLKLGGHKLQLPPRSYVCQFEGSEWDDDGDDADGGSYDDDDGEMGSLELDAGSESNARGTDAAGEKAARKVKDRMRHVYDFKKAHEMAGTVRKDPLEETDYFCAPCFFDMDQDDGGDDEGTEKWLLGLPFFREYYTNFRTTSNYREARRISFAKADESCTPQVMHGADGGVVLQQSSGVQRVAMRKLRLPTSKDHVRKLLEQL